MRYQVISKMSLVDGPGVRCALYVSGCTLRCKGCHNAEAWDFGCGKEFTTDEISKILSYLDHPYIRGFSLLGGEPFDQNPDLLIDLLSQIKSNFPDKDVWCWTGYEFDQIKDREIINYIDVIVCGPFKLELRDISNNNQWRGSTNQYVVDVKQSISKNKVILLPGVTNNFINN